MATRSKCGIVQPRLHLTLLLTELEPTSYKVALKDPKWSATMNEEYQALVKNHIWSASQQTCHWLQVGFQDKTKSLWHHKQVQSQIGGKTISPTTWI